MYHVIGELKHESKMTGLKSKKASIEYYIVKIFIDVNTVSINVMMI